MLKDFIYLTDQASLQVYAGRAGQDQAARLQVPPHGTPRFLPTVNLTKPLGLMNSLGI